MKIKELYQFLFCLLAGYLIPQAGYSQTEILKDEAPDTTIAYSKIPVEFPATSNGCKIALYQDEQSALVCFSLTLDGRGILDAKENQSIGLMLPRLMLQSNSAYPGKGKFRRFVEATGARISDTYDGSIVTLNLIVRKKYFSEGLQILKLALGNCVFDSIELADEINLMASRFTGKEGKYFPSSVQAFTEPYKEDPYASYLNLYSLTTSRLDTMYHNLVCPDRVSLVVTGNPDTSAALVMLEDFGNFLPFCPPVQIDTLPKQVLPGGFYSLPETGTDAFKMIALRLGPDPKMQDSEAACAYLFAALCSRKSPALPAWQYDPLKKSLTSDLNTFQGVAPDSIWNFLCQLPEINDSILRLVKIAFIKENFPERNGMIRTGSLASGKLASGGIDFLENFEKYILQVKPETMDSFILKYCTNAPIYVIQRKSAVPSEADSIELFAPSELIDKPFYYTNSNDSFPKGINEEVFANLVATLKMNPGSSLIIGVYTDEKSREQENVRISQQRAEYIATKLEKEYAFSPESMFAMGMGGKFPLEQKSKKSSSKENRRLVFGILKLE